jgi:hypothetical protein
MTDLETAYRRLLAWYTPAWRRRNGQAIMGTMLDAADADGRHAPTLAERQGLVRRGLIDRIQAYLPVALVFCAAGVLIEALVAKVQWGVNFNSLVIVTLTQTVEPGWVFYLIHGVVALICVALALPMIVRRRRVLRRIGLSSDSRGAQQ